MIFKIGYLFILFRYQRPTVLAAEVIQSIGYDNIGGDRVVIPFRIGLFK